MKTRFISEYLEQRKQQGQLRQLRTIPSGENYLNFSSNNTLGLASHPLLIQRASEYAAKFGVGAGASRLVCGNFPFHDELEAKLARLIGTEAALLFNSGYQANATVLTALADRHSVIIADKNCHHSILHGAITSHAKVMRYRHHDLKHLETLLKMQKDDAQKIIVTESIFSIDGDQSDVLALKALADHYHALLYIDEAHAVGITGKRGMGLCAGISGIDIVMGGFGKAAGSCGGYVACTHQMRSYLINACPGIIYSTGVAPPIAGAIDAALELIPKYEDQRKQLNENARWLRTALMSHGCNVGFSSTHIIPLWLKDSHDALAISEKLEKKGVLVYPIRPPTVPQGKSCLRISVSVHHTKEHLECLVKALSEAINGN